MEATKTEIPDRYREQWLADLDGRTAFARDLRQREASVIADLGGEGAVSYIEKSLVRRGLFLETLVRRTEARIASGETLEDDELGRFVQAGNALLGVWKSLGLKRRARDVPSLHDYLRERANKTEAAT